MGNSSPEYMREWRQKNAGHKKAYAKKWYAGNIERQRQTNGQWRSENPEKIKEYNYRGYEKRLKIPWSSAYRNAHQRCNNPKNVRYARYGGRGIQFKMTMKDFEHLWFRDNAFLMDRPSIDRIDNDGHYEVENCRFIESVHNTKGA